MNKKSFIIGVVLIIGSSIIGWASLFLGGILAVKNVLFLKIGTGIYLFSWLPFGLGFLLAGKEGLEISKKFFRRIRTSLLKKK